MDGAKSSNILADIFRYEYREAVNITNIYYDGVGSSEPDEYVEIRIDDSIPIQLQNWTLHDDANHVFTFPNFTIQPGQVARSR